jgi:hypothetical protein
VRLRLLDFQEHLEQSSFAVAAYGLHVRVHCACISCFFQCILLLQITINRPDRRNAFRPLTVKELMRAFNDARDDSSIGVIILTGKVRMLSEDKQKKRRSIWVSMESG